VDKYEFPKLTICGWFKSFAIINGEKIKIKFSLTGRVKKMVEFECRFIDSS